jgi:hypothetical protein
MFKMIVLAKETLLDPNRRHDHDIKLGVKENETPKNIKDTSITSQIVGWGLLAFVAGLAIAGGFKSNRNN